MHTILSKVIMQKYISKVSYIFHFFAIQNRTTFGDSAILHLVYSWCIVLSRFAVFLKSRRLTMTDLSFESEDEMRAFIEQALPEADVKIFAYTTGFLRDRRVDDIICGLATDRMKKLKAVEAKFKTIYRDTSLGVSRQEGGVSGKSYRLSLQEQAYFDLYMLADHMFQEECTRVYGDNGYYSLYKDMQVGVMSPERIRKLESEFSSMGFEGKASDYKRFSWRV